MTLGSFHEFADKNTLLRHQNMIDKKRIFIYRVQKVK